MQLIHGTIEANESLPRIPLKAERWQIVKRRWRGIAEDGAEFGFDLAQPLHDGDPFFASENAVYFLLQMPEPVLEIALIPRAAPVARLGWAIGNLHLPIQVTDDCIRVTDDLAFRRLLERENIPYIECERVFVPFATSHAHAAAS